MLTETIYAGWATVTADSTQPKKVFVPRFPATTYHDVTLSNAAGATIFQAGDNVNVISLGFSISPICPISYVVGTTIYEVIPARATLKSALQTKVVFDDALPFSPYELAVNQNMQSPTDSAFVFTFGSSFIPSALTGMIPAQYDGYIFALQAFAKIQHSKAMAI